MGRGIRLLAVIALLAAACGGDSGADESTPAPTSRGQASLPPGFNIDLPPGFEGELAIGESSVPDDAFALDTEILAVFAVDVDVELGGPVTLTYETGLVVGDDGLIPDVWLVTTDDGTSWNLPSERSITVAETGEVTVSAVIDGFSTVVAAKGSKGWKFTPRTVTAQVGEHFSANIQAVPGLSNPYFDETSTRAIAAGSVSFVDFEFGGPGGPTFVTYSCDSEGDGTFGVQHGNIVFSEDRARVVQSTEAMKALLYFFGAPAGAALAQDFLDSVPPGLEWYKVFVPTIKVTGDATCFGPAILDSAAEIPVEILQLLEAGEIAEDDAFITLPTPPPTVDIASLVVEVTDEGLIFMAEAVDPGPSEYGGITIFGDTADGTYVDFSFDFLLGEDGNPVTFATGAVIDPQGDLHEIPPPAGQVGTGFSITVPIFVRDGRLIVETFGVEDPDISVDFEITEIGIVIFRDPALATYQIPFPVLLELIPPAGE